MAVVIIGGKQYIIYEMRPTVVEPNDVELIKDSIRKKEKKSREQSWKQAARFGYRKK